MECRHGNFWIGLGIGSILGAVAYRLSRTAKAKQLESDIYNAIHRIGRDAEIAAAEAERKAMNLGLKAVETGAKVADKVSGYFVPVVIVLAILTFIVYLAIGQTIETAITVFVTILVVACPCSLGLATPLAIIVSEGICATNGILIKQSAILENAQKTTVVVFDKTGTLTYGKLKISEVRNYSKLTDNELLQIVGSIEEKTTHPIGKAFTDYMKENKISPLNINEFENITGYGITGKIDNKNIIIGSSKILNKYDINNPYEQDEKDVASKGNSIVYVIQDKEILALIGVNDIVREEAKEVINTLSSMNIETVMLTGDNKETASKIAQELGISRVVSDVLPKEKANMVNELKTGNRFVMMCGDGINDSPALANADIGISVKSGTDIAMDSSDVILTKNNLSSIVKLINISKKTIKNIKQNLFWAFFYNCLMIPVAMGIFRGIGISITPMIASLAMVFSSITVILNELRLKRIK